jgi:hypothetical protein
MSESKRCITCNRRRVRIARKPGHYVCRNPKCPDRVIDAPKKEAKR